MKYIRIFDYVIYFILLAISVLLETGQWICKKLIEGVILFVNLVAVMSRIFNRN
jgi:hypothetical protein